MPKLLLFILTFFIFIEIKAQCNGNDTAWTIKEQQAFVGYNIKPINTCLQAGNLTINNSNSNYPENERLVYYDLKTNICNKEGLEINISSLINQLNGSRRFELYLGFENGTYITLRTKAGGDFVNDNKLFVGGTNSTFSYELSDFGSQFQNLCLFKLAFLPNNYLSLSMNGNPILNHNDPSIGFQYSYSNLGCSIKTISLLYTGSSFIDSISIKNNNGFLYQEYFNSCNTLSPPPICNNAPLNLSALLPNCNANNLSLTANTNGYTNFAWTGPNGYTSNLQNPVIVNPIAGNYIVNATNSTACAGSIVKSINVIFIKSYFNKSRSVSICQGNNFFVAGQNQNTSGNYLDTIVTNSYCDTILNTTLTVNDYIRKTISVAICQGQSFLGHTTTGNYIDTLTTSNGCDSIRTLVLTIKPKVFSSIIQSICEGQNYLGYNAAGIYTDTLIAVNGCDSVRTLYLTLKQKKYSTISQTICQGQSYLGYNTSGNFIDTLIATNGCDSIRTLNLIVKPKATSTILISICEGTSYAGHTSTGTFVDTYIAANGCDSIRTLNLIIYPRKYTTVNINKCKGENYFAGGAVQTTTGIYKDTAYTSNGCDSIITTNLVINPLPMPNLGVDKDLCFGNFVTLNPGSFSTYNWHDGSTNPTFIANAIGEYFVKVKNIFGCAASDTMYVTNVFPLPLSFMPYDISFCRGNTIILKPTQIFPNYLWNTGSTNFSIPISNYGNYNLSVTDSNGCKATETTIVKRAACYSLVMPNAFSPNADGNNDVFKPQVNEPVTNYTLQVWSRWGKQIYESKDPYKGWDGTYQNAQQPMGTYVYVLVYTDYDNKLISTSGEITLIR